MRAALYGLGWVVMLSAVTGIALLPRMVPSLLFFALGGAFLSALVAGSWVLLGATAGRWPRPRTGWMLLGFGLAGILFWPLQRDWPLAGWSSLMLLVGAGLIFPLFPVQKGRKESEDAHGPVRPPLGGRREQI